MGLQRKHDPTLPALGLWGLPAAFSFFTGRVPTRSSAGPSCLCVTAPLAVAARAFAAPPSLPFLPLQLPSSYYTVGEASVGRILTVPALSSASHTPVEAYLPCSVLTCVCIFWLVRELLGSRA